MPLVVPHRTAQSFVTREIHGQSRWRSQRNLLLRSCRSTSSFQIRRRKRSVTTACAGNPVPYIPFPGDNQAAAVYTAISQEAEADDAESTDIDKASTSQPSTNSSPPPGKQPRIPHRWRVVLMMALAFVLCNMDKVYSSACKPIAFRCLIHCLLLLEPRSVCDTDTTTPIMWDQRTLVNCQSP